MRAFCNPELDFFNAVIFCAMQLHAWKMATIYSSLEID
jgi:hypothetical protein